MNEYNCPYCFVHLNVNGFIVLALKNPHGKNGLILLSDTLGDYDVHLNPAFKFEHGEKGHFHCPACNKSLEYHDNENLVRIFKTEEDGERFTIVFSAIFGEKSTYRISEKRAVSYGENALKYMDPEWYLKE